jgi:hypothetical protein
LADGRVATAGNGCGRGRSWATAEVNNDQAGTDRLREIVDGHGWPTCDVVGEEANRAAWVIAQHADQDVEYQQ